MLQKRILVVDDEPLTRSGIKKTLEAWSQGKYEILCAEGAGEASQIMLSQKIHLLITDISMPEMSGLEMLESIKKQIQPPVVIIISSYPEFDYAREAIQLGVLNYLLKPINKHKLIEAVEKALEVEATQEKVDIFKRVIDEKWIDVKKEERHQEHTPIQKAIHYIDEHLDKQLSLKEVAQHVHLNPSYFSVLFKDQTNLTFSEYVTRSRLQKAKNLLLTSQLSISEIAEIVGYTTAKYFIKLFKSYEAMTPSQFRKQSKADK